VGEFDENVLSRSSLKFMGGFIKAQNFGLVCPPNQSHPLDRLARKHDTALLDYFVRWLLGAPPPQ